MKTKTVENEAVEIISDISEILPLKMRKFANILSQYCAMKIKHSHKDGSKKYKFYQSVQDKIKKQKL